CRLDVNQTRSGFHPRTRWAVNCPAMRRTSGAAFCRWTPRQSRRRHRYYHGGEPQRLRTNNTLDPAFSPYCRQLEYIKNDIGKRKARLLLSAIIRPNDKQKPITRHIQFADL